MNKKKRVSLGGSFVFLICIAIFVLGSGSLAHAQAEAQAPAQAQAQASTAESGGQTETLKFPPLTPQQRDEIQLLDTHPLEDFFETKVEVATRGGTPLSSRQAPATVTVITADDIKVNHCRDLVDVFNMVPGFNVSQDIESEPSWSMRGLYAFDGRGLIMIDGITISDLYHGEYVIGNDFPIHMIDRIEITKSPGFVLYGSSAELGVINIITKKGSQIQGAEVRGRYGQLASGNFGHYDFGVNPGYKGEHVEISGIAFAGNAMSSGGDWTQGYYGPAIPANQATSLVEEKALALKATINNRTEIKAYYNDHNSNTLINFTYDPTVDNLDQLIGQNPWYTRSIDAGGGISHRIDFSSELTLTPSLEYQWGNDEILPDWQHTFGFAQHPIERTKVSILSRWTPEQFELVTGAEAYQDHGSRLDNGLDPDVGYRKYPTDPISDQVWINTYGGFLSASYKVLPYYFFSGFRYEWNEISGDIIVPRAGVTYVSGPFHAKLLYSQTYRAPRLGENAWSLAGMDASKPWRPLKVTPERGSVSEIEVGYRFADRLNTILNLFYEKTSNVIQFTEVGGTGTMPFDAFWANGGELGSWGGELQFDYRATSYHSVLSFSYHKLAEAAVPDHLTPPNNDSFLGIPDFKIYTNHSYSLTDKLSVQANALYLSSVTAQFQSAATDPNLFYTDTIGPQLIFGAGLLWDEPLKNFNVGLSIHDMFNQHQRLVTASQNSGADPMQYKGREISLDVAYRF